MFAHFARVSTFKKMKHMSSLVHRDRAQWMIIVCLFYDPVALRAR